MTEPSPLAPPTLLNAYCNGIFPMYVAEEDGIFWFRPEVRCILPLDGFHVSRSLAKLLRQQKFEVTLNNAFTDVMIACADRAEGTWISSEIIDAYTALHDLGYAHSVEVWNDGWLVGGLYGVAIGRGFMAESMFHRESNASKVAVAALVAHLNSLQFQLLDVQYLTPHLASLGAVEISNAAYLDRLRKAIE